ncbi:uncharacterized protein TNCV_4744981 [Trichonephila clavipes]|nr:uncharacterized protein TNCV_4744981 [Trichonephila clavipes]
MLNSCVMHRHTGPAPGIMVWGGIGYHSRTPLVRIAGTLNRQRYISGVLEPVVLPYLQGNRDYTGMRVRLGSTDLMAGKVMFLRSNQGDRLDGNESVADSFRSDLIGFKSWSGRILGAFFPLTSARKTFSREANSLPEVTLPSLHSHQISTTLITTTPDSSFAPTPLGHDDNLEVRHHPRANTLQSEGRKFLSHTEKKLTEKEVPYSAND